MQVYYVEQRHRSVSFGRVHADYSLPFISERTICCRPSVCLSSVVCLQRSCTLLRRLKFSAIFLRHLVPWPSVDAHRKFYGDRPRGTPLSGKLNITVVAKQRFWTYRRSRKRCKIGGKLVLMTNMRSHMRFRLVPKSVTLNDLERHNGRYFALFQRIR